MLGPHRPGDYLGMQVKESLSKLGKLTLSNLEVRFPDRIALQVSKGKGYLPRILWFAITPKGRKVSNDMSVVVCFGFKGEGAVGGVMDSLSFPRGVAKTVNRTGHGQLLVDVNGGKQSNNYNNKFVNPVEFLEKGFSAEPFLRHMSQSVELLRSLRSRY